MNVLAGDVGGTKTLLRIASDEGEVLASQRFESAKYAHLSVMVAELLAAHAGAERPKIAAFGVAGPVVDGASKTTNLPWQLEEKALARACELDRVKLMNDFEATAYGVLELPPEGLATLQVGSAATRGMITVIGAGTGLGEAFVVRGDHPGEEQVVASEGGHADFAPRDDLEIELLRYLRTRYGRVSWERVVSGHGIANVYEFLRDTKVVVESPDVARELSSQDVGAVIGKHALAGDDALCMRTIDLFLASYGAEAGNLALKGLATGGVYVTGGIAPKLLPLLKGGSFLRSYRDKGRLSSVVERSPVHVVLDQETPLRGAMRVALRMGR